jgi:hypothetical protein
MLKRAIAALAMAITTSGCMQYLVQPPQPSLAGTPQTVEAKSYAGGKVQQPGLSPPTDVRTASNWRGCWSSATSARA